jgi:hypothetical protein
MYVPLLGSLSEVERSRLAGLTREWTELRRESLSITADNLTDLLAVVPTRVPDRAHRLLAAVSRRTEFFGQTIKLHLEDDVPLAYAWNSDEFRHFVDYLHDERLIKRGESSNSCTIEVLLTPLGSETLEARLPSGLDSDSAFIAMWFDWSVADAFFKGIKPAVEEDCGFRAVRIDLEEHNDDIMDRVLAEIRRSRFLVADFTKHRNGVYFEAGYALGLPIPVIWLCRQDEIAKAHFDIEHFNHIKWADTAELRDRLALRITATVGMGPHGGTSERDPVRRLNTITSGGTAS